MEKDGTAANDINIRIGTLKMFRHQAKIGAAIPIDMDGTHIVHPAEEIAVSVVAQLIQEQAKKTNVKK